LFESNWRSLDIRYGFMDAAKTLARKIGPIRRTINWVINGPVKYDYLLANGNFYPEYTRHFVKIHHVKYDEYLQSKSLPPLLDGPYAVFLDTAATTHPFYNLKRHAGKRKVDTQGYIDRLNRFFDQVEKEHNLPVIIAAGVRHHFDDVTCARHQWCRAVTPAAQRIVNVMQYRAAHVLLLVLMSDLSTLR